MTGPCRRRHQPVRCLRHSYERQGVKSCTLLALSCEDADILTIEGLANGQGLHPMQEAFRENHGLQCGFCTPGMIMTAVDLVNRKGGDLDESIRSARNSEGNICTLHGATTTSSSAAAGRRRTWKMTKA